MAVAIRCAAVLRRCSRSDPKNDRTTVTVRTLMMTATSWSSRSENPLCLDDRTLIEYVTVGLQVLVENVRRNAFTLCLAIRPKRVQVELAPTDDVEVSSAPLVSCQLP